MTGREGWENTRDGTGEEKGSGVELGTIIWRFGQLQDFTKLTPLISPHTDPLNRRAYYEAGFAKGLGIPVYFIVREGFTSHNPADDSTGMRIHFGTAQIMYRVWKQPTDLEQVLRDWIESTIGRYGELRSRNIQ